MCIGICAEGSAVATKQFTLRKQLGMYFQSNNYLVFFICFHVGKGKVQCAVGNKQLAVCNWQWTNKSVLKFSGRLLMLNSWLMPIILSFGQLFLTIGIVASNPYYHLERCYYKLAVFNFFGILISKLMALPLRIALIV